MKLVIGSRGSQLALWQAHWVSSQLKELGHEVEIEIIRTTGDKVTDVPLAKVGGKGLFTKEIEDALLEGRVDLAVHSLKDLPTVLPEGLALAAVPPRELPLDALVGRRLDELPMGARVGTSSLRRSAQLKRLRPDLRIESVRGNLDTRLRKLDEGQFDAILLAAAGLRRLGWENRITELLDPRRMCPAVGQGALGIETRESGAAREAVAELDDASTRAAVAAERAVLAGLGGGCQVPIGAYATVDSGTLELRSVVVDPDGRTLVEDKCSGPAARAAEMGTAAARRLLEGGARQILASVYGLALAGQRVVVTRAQTQAGGLAERLRGAGAEVFELPAIECVALEFEPPDWAAYDWAVFTSANAVECLFGRLEARSGPKLCAIGPATAEALRRHGLDPDVVAQQNVGEGVVAALEGEPLAGRRVLLPRAAVARDVIAEQLGRQGAEVDVLAVYETRMPVEFPARAAELLSSVRPDWITLTSGSTVRSLVSALGTESLGGIRLASIGPQTSAMMRASGLTVSAEAESASVEALVDAICSMVKKHEAENHGPAGSAGG